MKAVVYDEASRDGLSLERDAKSRTCGPRDVRIRVVACALDASDARARDGAFQSVVALPRTPGTQIAGTVESVGACVKGFSPGDRIAAICSLDRQGGLAELCVVPAATAVRVPPTVPLADAAAALLDGLRAYHAVHYLANVKADTFACVVCDCASLGGLIVTLLSRIRGCKVLAVGKGFASSTGRHSGDSVRIVRVVDPACDDFEKVVSSETGGLGLDVIIDIQMQPVRRAPGPTSAPQPAAHSDAIDAKKPAKVPSKTTGQNIMASGDSKNAQPVIVAETASSARFVSRAECLRCLAVHGCLVTADRRFRLTADEAEQLYFRSASIGFLFSHTWLLSPRNNGKLAHIMADLMDGLKTGEMTPVIGKMVSKLDLYRSGFRFITSGASSGKAVVCVGGVAAATQVGADPQKGQNISARGDSSSDL